MDKEQFKNIQGEILANCNLARHTSWRVGGDASLLYRPANLEDLRHFLAQLPASEPLTWLGLGSNVLVRDGGIDGVVILTLNRLNEISLVDDNIIRAEAGVTCAKLAKYCIKHGFEEGVFFAGIPGTVGGALAMNAGAFQGETWRHVKAVDVINRSGQLFKRLPQDFSIGYRHVGRNQDEYFAAGYFQFAHGDSVQAQEKLKTLLQRRNSTQPIGTFSCGSVFRNPEGDFAARLVEAAGLKGYANGQVQVSDVHANFILNKGQARASEIEDFIGYVMERVAQRHGVKLVPEFHVLGKK